MDREYRAEDPMIWNGSETELGTGDPLNKAVPERKEVYTENEDKSADKLEEEQRRRVKQKKRIRRQMNQEQKRIRESQKTVRGETQNTDDRKSFQKDGQDNAFFNKDFPSKQRQSSFFKMESCSNGKSNHKKAVQKGAAMLQQTQSVSHLLFSDKDSEAETLEANITQSSLQFGSRSGKAAVKKICPKPRQSRWLIFESENQSGQDLHYNAVKNRKHSIVWRYQQNIQFMRQRQPVRQILSAVKSRLSKSGSAFGFAALFLILIGTSMFATCSAVLTTGGGSVVASSYQASDEDLMKTNEAYCRLEQQLQYTIDTIEQTYPGYEVYEYQVDEIEHNPYTLMSYLTATRGDFHASEVDSILKTLFDSQYRLTVQEQIRTQVRTVQKTREVTDPDTGAIRQEVYEESEPYEQTVFCVKLTNHKLENMIPALMSDDEYLTYQVYQENYGNRSYLFGLISPGTQDFEVPKEALDDEKFAAMITEAEKYLGMAYVWGGSSPQTGFDCSGFISWVINHSIENVGRQTANGLYQMTSRVSPQEAKPGDLIFFQKTYDTAGASHVGLYVGSGMMIHCGNPIQYVSVNSAYYQEHFLGYGRLY